METRILQLETDVGTLANVVRELIGAMESDNAGTRSLAIGMAKRMLPSAPVPDVLRGERRDQSHVLAWRSKSSPVWIPTTQNTRPPGSWRTV